MTDKKTLALSPDETNEPPPPDDTQGIPEIVQNPPEVAPTPVKKSKKRRLRRF